MSFFSDSKDQFAINWVLSLTLLLMLLLITVWFFASLSGFVENAFPLKQLPSSQYSWKGLFSVWLILFSVGLLIALYFSHRIPNALLIYLSSIIIRTAVMVIQVNYFLFDDEIFIHWSAVVINNYNLSPPSYLHFSLYDKLIGGLYYLWGQNIFIPKIMNTIIGSLIPLLVYDISWEIFKNRKIAYYAAILAIFAPPLVIYSGTNLKETVTAFLILLSIWFIRYKKLSIINGGMSIFCVFLIAYLRGIFVVPVIIAISIIFTSRLRISKKGILTIGFLLAAITIFLANNYINILGRVSENWVLSYQADRIATTQGVSKNIIDKQSVFGYTNIGLSFIKTLLPIEPFLFMTEPDFMNLLRALIGIFWLAAFPMGLAAIIFITRYDAAHFLIKAFSILGLASLFLPITAWIGGIPSRHLVVFSPIWIILGFYSAINFKNITKNILTIWTIAYMVMLLLYFVIKIRS